MQTNLNSLDRDRAMNYYQNREFEKALPIFDKLIKYGNNDDLLEFRGFALQALGCHDEAIRDFYKSLNDSKNDADMLFAIAISKGDSGDLAGKILALDQALSIMEQYPQEYEEFYNICNATLKADNTQYELRKTAPESKQVKQKEASQTKSRIVNVVKLVLLIPLTFLVYGIVYFIAHLIFDIRKSLENLDLSHWGEKPSLFADIIANVVACFVIFELVKLIMKGYSLAGNVVVGVSVIVMNLLAIVYVGDGYYELYRAIGPAISIIIALVYIFYKPDRIKHR